MLLAELLVRQARLQPDRAAIFHGTQSYANYWQWAARSAGLAKRLTEAGLSPGDRVLLYLNNHPRYLEILWAAWWAGLVVVPVNAKLHPREVEWIIENAEPGWGFVSQDLLQAPLAGLKHQVEVESALMDELLTPLPNPLTWPLEARQPEDTAWLFYTSGTTGRPKGVMITQRNLLTMGMSYFVNVDQIHPDDAMVYAAPMSHGAGLYAIPHLMAGARHLVPTSGGVDPDELMALGRALGPMTTFAAPTIVKRLVDHALHHGLTPQQSAQIWKTIVYGGAPMYLADIQRALQVMGPRFVQIYGQGESPMTITAMSRDLLNDTAHPSYLHRLASVGLAQAPVQLQVVDDAGLPLPNGQIGEVLVKGDSVMAGYWRNPQATAAAVRGGWLWTGDVGCLDDEGFLTLKDRSKDLLISGGSNIYPREVEEVLLTARGVAQAAVVGAPHPEWGEEVVAFVVAQEDYRPSVAELDAHCLEHIARFKRPKRYLFVKDLPKNNYGKVLKTVLRQSLGAQDSH